MKNPKGFAKFMHEKINEKGCAEIYSIKNGYPVYKRIKK